MGVEKVEILMCKFYDTSGYPNFKPQCQLGYRASLTCHSENNNCKGYEPTKTSPTRARKGERENA